MEVIKHKVLIGIDPDVTKSGYARLDKNDGSFILRNLTFFELYDTLLYYSMAFENKITFQVEVFIEAGWLNKSNWHTSCKMSVALAAQIGQRTGANHETGKKIVEMCEYLNIKYTLVKPTKSKVDAKEFKTLTKYEGRTNQEQRDAAMLIVGR